MKKTRFGQVEIARMLNFLEQGKSLDEIIRELGISRASFYSWRKKCGGLESKELKRIKELEDENARLKKMYANLALDLDVAKHIIEKKL